MSIMSRRQVLANSAAALVAGAVPIEASATALSFPALSTVQRYSEERKQLGELCDALVAERDRITASLPKLPRPRVFMDSDLDHECPLLSERVITSTFDDPAPYLADFRTRSAIRDFLLYPPELQRIEAEIAEVDEAIYGAELGVIETPSRDLSDLAIKARLLAECPLVGGESLKVKLTVIIAEEAARFAQLDTMTSLTEVG